MEAGRPTWKNRPRPRRVQLQAPAGTPNSIGETAPAWKTVATVWASVEPLSGKELWAAQQVQPDVTHRLTLRYRPGIDASMRAILDGRALNFVSVLNLEERNRTLEIMAQEFAGGPV